MLYFSEILVVLSLQSDNAAHAVGAEYKGKRIGTLGDLTSFSFYTTKNMTTGEGGQVTFMASFGYGHNQDV